VLSRKAYSSGARDSSAAGLRHRGNADTGRERPEGLRADLVRLHGEDHPTVAQVDAQLKEVRKG